MSISLRRTQRMVETTALVALLWYVFAVQVWSASSGMRLKPRLRGRFALGDRLGGRRGSVHAGGRPVKSRPEAISIAERFLINSSPPGIWQREAKRQPRRGFRALREGLSPHLPQSSEEVQPHMRTAIFFTAEAQRAQKRFFTLRSQRRCGACISFTAEAQRAERIFYSASSAALRCIY